MIKWEYRFHSVNNVDIINPNQTIQNSLFAIPALGEDGWELVAVTPYSTKTLFTFKREKEDDNVRED